jgi:hypothetical protein
MAQSSPVGSIITLGVLAAAAYALYEWLSSECSTVGSTLYGGTICGLLPGTTVAAAPVTAPLTGTQQVQVTAPAVTTPPPASLNPVPPPITSTSLSTQLQNWANANGMGSSYIENGNSANPPGQLDADHWLAIYSYVTGNTVNPTQAGQLFFPNGRPANVAQNPVYSASEFVSILSALGGQYSGLSGINRIPMGMIHRGLWS